MSNYTETTTTSWGERLKQAFMGILVGLVLFVLAFPLLFWGEGRSVARYKTLQEGAGAVVAVSADKVDATNEGKLVYLTGKTATEEILKDVDFPVEVNAVKLKRNVEMFQWVEHQETTTQKKMGGSEEKVTEYTYSKEWSSSLVNSSNFKIQDGHANPMSLPYENSEYVAQKVTLGAFQLSESLISMMGPYEKYALPEEEAKAEDVSPAEVKTEENAPVTEEKAPVVEEKAPVTEEKAPVVEEKAADTPSESTSDTETAPVAEEKPAEAASTAVVEEKTETLTTQEDTEKAMIRSTTGYYLGKDPSTPEVGDVRVAFEVVYPGEISVISGQMKDSFSPYITTNKGSINLLQNGMVSAEGMFTKAQTDNTILTWILRVVGFLMMFIGLSMIFKPLSVLGDVVPFIGSIIGMGTGIIAFLIALICSLTTIAIAWLFYRPLFSIPLLVLAVILLVFLFTRKKKS